VTITNAAANAREAVAARREQLDEVLRRYGASNPRLFGSVARGDATTESDIDVLVDLDPARGNPWMRMAGLSEEFRGVLGVDVDVVAAELLRDGVAKTALADAVAL
jgi:predicted nucleotidyltransferase